MDYLTLTASQSTPGSISDWMNDPTIQSTSSYIVDEAQDWIYQRLRHWRMMPPAVTGLMSTTTNTLTIPADMIEPDFFMVTGVYRRIIPQRTVQELMASWTYDSNGALPVQQPSLYSFDNTNINFDSVADQAYPYAFLYYQSPPRLSATNPTNFLTTKCTRLLRLAIMMMAAEWSRTNPDRAEDRTYYAQEATEELGRVQASSDRARRGSGGGWIEGGIGGPYGGYGGYGYGLAG